MTVIKLTANTLIGIAYADDIILVDATAGAIVLTLDDPASFGVGVVTIKKIDDTSNPVTLVPATGTFEMGRASFVLSLVGDACKMASDGTNWWMVEPGLTAFRHSFLGCAEHDIAVPFYNIDPSYNNYLMLCDTASAGASQEIVLPDMTVAAFGHQCFMVGVMHFDSAPTSNIVSVVSQPGQPIICPGAVWLGTPGSSSMKLDLPTNLQCKWFWTDKARWTVPASNGL